MSAASGDCKTTLAKSSSPASQPCWANRRNPCWMCWPTQKKMRWIDSAELFIGSRKLLNLRVHEHMADPLLFLQALSAKREAADRLFSTVSALEAEAEAVGLRDRLVQSLPGVPQSLDAIKTITSPWLKAVIASAARQSMPRFSSFFAAFPASNGHSPL